MCYIYNTEIRYERFAGTLGFPRDWRSRSPIISGKNSKNSESARLFIDRGPILRWSRSKAAVI